MPQEKSNKWRRAIEPLGPLSNLPLTTGDIGVTVPHLSETRAREREHEYGSAIMDDDTKVLSDPIGEKDDDYISATFSCSPGYQDPNLELTFRCHYHDEIVAEDSEDDANDILDPRTTEKGYRSYHEGSLKLTTRDVKALRIINFETSAAENEEMHGMSFLESIGKWDSAIATNNIITNEDRDWPHALKNGHLNVLRIELEDGIEVKAMNMHPTQSLGAKDSDWRNITNNVTESSCINVVTTYRKDDLEPLIAALWSKWDKVHTSYIPFGTFYGKHPSKPFVKSGGEDDQVSRENRPTDFAVSANVAFMHQHEYVAHLAYGFIDDLDCQDDGIKKVISTQIEAKFIAIPNTHDREFLMLVPEDSLESANLQPGDRLRYTLYGEDTGPFAPSGPIPDNHEEYDDDPEIAMHEKYELLFQDLPESGPERREGMQRLKLAEEAEMLKKEAFKVEDIAPLWTGKVADYYPWTPVGWRTLFAIRPFKQSLNEFDFSDKIEAMDWKSIAAKDFDKRFENHISYRVMIDISIPETQRKQVLDACHEMYIRRNLMGPIWDILLMQRALNLPITDFYGTIPADYNFEGILSKLNAGQKAAFEKLRKMNGSLAAMQGPPGTGKTYWAANILVPLIDCLNLERKSRHQILSLAATNEQADKFAADLVKYLPKHANHNGKEVTVIRVLPWQVEGLIARKEDAHLRKKSLKSKNVEGSALAVVYHALSCSDIDLSGSTNQEQAVQQMLVGARNTALISATGFSNPRVRNLEYHLGTHMIKALKADHSKPLEDREWPGLWLQLTSFRDGNNIEATALIKLKAGIRDLRDSVLRNADVLVATPYAACQGYLRDIFKPSHVIIDEASQITEPQLWPVLTWYTHGYNELFRAMLLLGDDKLIPPTVLAQKNDCFFREQLTLSLFSRLQACGLTLPSLYQQRRMHRDIAKGPKMHLYGDRLTTHSSTSHLFNESARRMGKLNQYLMEKLSNLIVIDSASGRQEQSKTGPSIYNEQNGQVIVALIKKILTNGSPQNPYKVDRFCVLTFYLAQERLLRKELARLHEENPSLGVNTIRIATVDKYQGHEADIVFLDMVIVSSIGFVQDPGRLNSALTRAKHALYVIVSFESVLSILKKQYDLKKKKGDSYVFKGWYLLATMQDWRARGIVKRPKFIDDHLELWEAQQNQDNLATDKVVW